MLINKPRRTNCSRFVQLDESKISKYRKSNDALILYKYIYHLFCSIFLNAVTYAYTYIGLHNS